MNGWPAQVTWSEPREDREYRYVWRLSWDPRKRPLLVAALIPSYADETRADPTVQYCIDVAAAKEYGELVVVNMFARYDTPSHQRAHKVDLFDLIGEDNDQHIRAEALKIQERGGTIVAAWGDSGWSRHGRVRSLLCEHAKKLWCFGTKDSDGQTANGFPYHPGRRGALRGVSPEAVVLKPFCSCT